MSGNLMADSNEECCGACRSGGDLICCEGCPAAFHPECAGYYADDEVPKGDWLCWFCCKDQGKRYQHPKTQFQHPGGLVPILLATDDSAEVFCRVKLLHESDRYMEFTCVDIQSESEIVPKTSPRLWHGTINKAAWTIDADNVHWRPNCRLFKVDKAAMGRKQQQQDGSSPDRAPVHGTHSRGNAQQHASQQDQQQTQHAAAAAAAGASKQKPPAAPTRLSVPPSPLLAGVESVGVLSPDSAGGPSPGGVAYNAAVEKALEVAAKRGVQRIPVGEVGAGLPVVQGGAGKDLFDGALHHFWKGYSRVSREKVPSHITIGGNPVDTWVFWREVWAWGGPEEVQKNKLWATIGHCFNPPPGATSLSSRMSQFYNTMLAPFDKAVDAGNLKLERPAANRVPTDRWLQIRSAPAQAPGPKRRNSQGNLQAAAAPSSAAPSPTNSSGGTAAVSGSTAAAAAAAVEDPAAPAGGRSGSGKQRQRQRQRKPRAKRRRADQWSDNDEDDVILADDVESTDESDDGRQDSSEDEAPTRQRQRQQQKGLREGGGTAGGNGSGSSKPSKRLRVNMSKVKEELVADGLDSAGGYEYLRQPTDFVVLGKVTLTPAAQAIQVGDVVDFRQACSSGKCVTGWRSGTVLAIAPGSEWEGGRRLLIKPRHAIHHHHHQQQQGSASSLPPESPAAAALAAVAAAGGPIGGAAAESAAQKLLTPSGHLRHELAGLLPARSGSVKLGSAGDTGGTPPPPAAAATAAVGGSGQQQQQQQQQQRAGSDGADASDQPVWVPMVWRGDCWQPFLAPPVLVRPHYAPNTALVVGTGGSRAAEGDRSAESPFASPQQQQQGHGQQQQQQELRVGAYVEALKEGCWCPAQVLEVLQNGGGWDGGSGTCVVLRSMAPPEADGSVWRCSGTHPMRPMHPRYTSGCGVVQCAGPEELVTVAAMKKSLAPYLYSEGVHAFACLDHMHAAARAAAQG